MKNKVDEKSLMKTRSWNSLQNFQDLSDREIIDKLFEIINQQQENLAQFTKLLANHMQKIKRLQKKFAQETQYNQLLHKKLEQSTEQNKRFKIQIGLLRSDNLILKSKLMYQEQKKKNSDSKLETEGCNDEEQGRIKLTNMRTCMKRLLKIISKLIINNQKQQNQIIQEISQIMKLIR